MLEGPADVRHVLLWEHYRRQRIIPMMEYQELLAMAIARHIARATGTTVRRAAREYDADGRLVYRRFIVPISEQSVEIKTGEGSS